MKDSEFIELLNLYLDHEISAADAARLEAEVQNNPARRRIYQDYCRMQKACKLLADDFASEPATAEEGKVVDFEQAVAQGNSRSAARYLTAGLLATAACVALVFVGRTRPTPVAPSSAPVVAQTETPRAAPSMTTPADADVPSRPSNGLSIRNRQQAEKLALASAQIDPHYAWMYDFRLAPLQSTGATQPLAIDAATNTKADNRTYTSGNKPMPADVQMTAIRFQR